MTTSRRLWRGIKWIRKYKNTFYLLERDVEQNVEGINALQMIVENLDNNQRRKKYSTEGVERRGRYGWLLR